MFRNRLAHFLLALTSAGLIACGGDTFTQPEKKSTDLLLVTVTLSGLLPSRTVQVIVNDTISVDVTGPTAKDPLFARGTLMLPVGTYHVHVTGLDPNCQEPAAKEVRIRGLVPGSADFQVECRDDHALAGRGLSWVNESDDGWGNDIRSLSIRTESGTVITPPDGKNSYDAAWSENGEALAVLRRGQDPGVVFMAPDGRVQPGGTAYIELGAAIAWIPGQGMLSVLNLARSSCQVRFVQQSSTVVDSLACGEPGDVRGSDGDLAWSPDGRKAAIAAGSDSIIRILDRDSRLVLKASLPAGHAPTALEWSTDGSALFVLAYCPTPGCDGRGLVLLRHDPVAGSWDQLAKWTSGSGRRFSQTLALLDSGHLAVGSVEGGIQMVSLDASHQSRVFMPWTGYRVSRRP